MADAMPPSQDVPVEDLDTVVGSSPPSRTPGGGSALGLASFVGRQREISEIKSLLDGGTRLLTLTGPGGSGKTRLASAAAFETLERFEDGVWWVELAPISDPDLVPQSVAQVLNVYERPGRPLTDVIVEDLKELDVLLVLDNCEHLVGACAELAWALLRACHRLGILATSREALGLAGERSFPVPPLSVPDPENPPEFASLTQYEAIRLFLERAQDVAPAFELTEQNAPVVAKVCRTLDGMPLAIELAAARVRVLSVEQISSRLEDSFSLLAGGSRTAEPRQRTLRAAIDWSYDLLPEEERVLFRRLSVFAGGFSLDAAETVCAGIGIERHEVLDLLSHLIDKSLVVVAERDGKARYGLLQTVRRYALERLEHSGEEAELLGERHARYYLALAEEAEPELKEQVAWLERLEREHDNFRSALSWALESQDEHPGARAELGLRLAAALAQGRFWNAYGPSEGRRWLETGLASSGTSPTPVRAKALSQAGWLAIYEGDYRRAVALLDEGMALFEEQGDKSGVAISLFHLGHMALHGGDRERAKALALEAEALHSELSDQQAIGLLHFFLGMFVQDEGEYDRAVGHYEEGLALHRELGDLRGMAMCLTALGASALEKHDPARAAAFYEEDLRVLRRLKDKTGTAYGLRGMACVAALRGDAVRAARIWGAAETLAETISLPLSAFDRSHPDYESLIKTARSSLNDETVWEVVQAEGRAMATAEAVEYALGADDAAPASPEVPSSSSMLSARETEIVSLVADGLTNPQIAKTLYLSPRTVGQHLRSIYRKLGVPSRAAAAREAVDRGLI
jgi:predicted ATPase/DNA-binding NarL/FixJ family response regulator